MTPRTLTAVEKLIWAKAWWRSLNSGDDHGYAAYAADEAVKRDRKKREKQ